MAERPEPSDLGASAAPRGQDWEPRSAVPPLAHGTVQCWLDRLDASPPWAALPLPPDERTRAARFVAAERRDAFVRGRQLIRYLLGQHLGLAPGDVPLRVRDSGKPELGLDEPALTFSLSHSGPWVLCALSHAGPVGVDIEHTNRAVDHEAIVRRYFADEERAGLAALDGEARRAAFFRVWVRKEAIAKATGDGLAGTLSEIAVPLVDAPVLPMLRAAQGPDWWLHALPTPAPTVAALALPRASATIARCRWG